MGGVRVRFAPSPTGFLHMGVARTALMNWLFARREEGIFVLRIEDTDRSRSTQEYLDALLEDLEWLGLQWDEGPERGGDSGPYLQSERGGTYGPHAERLLAEGRAYHCFCTPDELDERRRRGQDEAGGWIYDRRCLALSNDERQKRLTEGRPAALRFLVPEGTTSFDDMVLGRIEFDNRELDDLVLMRPDGTPTYNFAVVVDDLEMSITHVIRGADHVSNTPRQILIWEALGEKPPAFGHLPLVLDQSKQVLSKRRGALAVGEYRRRGYVPEALINYMALLGWSYDGEREFFSLDELAREFDIRRVSRKAAVLDPDKLIWMNMQWIKRLPVDDRTDRVIPFLREDGLLSGTVAPEERERLERIVELIDDRLKTLADAGALAGFFLAPDVVYDNIAVSKVLAKPGADDTLAGLQEVLAGCPDFDPATLETAFRTYAEGVGLPLGKVVQPVRVAVTGGTASPGIFETLSLIGREESLARIAKARELAS